MNTAATETRPKAKVVYPESDGEPMADNTRQFEWIVTLKGGLDAVFRDDPDVFVAGDLLWYPVEGDNATRVAPDAMVVFGRPKGYRGSYRQWEEGGVAPQVVFEVLSPGNRVPEMVRKLRFYERHGVEEYYLLDPDAGTLDGWRRSGPRLEEIPEMNGYTSPRLGTRFDLSAGEIQIHGPDGRPFATYLELVREREQANERAEQANERAEKANERAEKLAARLKALGVEPED